MADVEMRDPVVEKDKEKEKDKPTELSPQEAQALLLAGIFYIYFFFTQSLPIIFNHLHHTHHMQ